MARTKNTARRNNYSPTPSPSPSPPPSPPRPTPTAGGWQLLASLWGDDAEKFDMPVVLAKVFEALEASRLSSKVFWLSEPEDTVTGGLAFCKATAVLRLVCRRWKAIHDAMVRRLHACRRLKITGEAASLLLTRFPAVTSVRFRRRDKANDVVRAMSMHPVWCTLQTIDLGQCLHSLTDNSLQAVSGAPALTTLGLSHCLEVTDAGIQTISSMPALTWLNLSSCEKITDEALRSVSRLPALKKLYLESCERITHVGLQAVSRMPTLELLNLRYCSGVTDEAVKAVSRMSSLTCLHLGHCRKVSKEAVLALIGMPALETLFLAHCDAYGIKSNHRHENPNQLTFENMKALIHGLPALTYLDLRFCADAIYEDGWGWMLEKEGWTLKEHSEEVEGGWMLEVKKEKKPVKRKRTAKKTENEGPNPELRIILSDEDITLPQFLE